MRYHELDEMPISITDLNMPAGDVSSFRNDDKKLLTSQKGLDKIHKLWATSVVDVDLYTLDLGVDPPTALSYAVDGAWDQESEDLAALKGLENRVKANPNSITIVFTNNEGAQRMPMTGWIIAHRMFHAFQSSKEGPVHQAKEAGLDVLCDKLFEQLRGVLFDLESYNYRLRQIDRANLIGSTKACRDFKLTQSGELIPECFAQFLLRGHVKLRTLPNSVTIGDKVYACEGELAMVNNSITYFEKWLTQKFTLLIGAAKGKVFSL